jgi:hypothetical protein
MIVWIIGAIIYLLIGCGFSAAMNTENKPTERLVGTERSWGALFLSVFTWPVEVGYLMGLAMRYFQKM